MDKKEPTLQELMDAVRKQAETKAPVKAPEPEAEQDLIFEDFFDEFEVYSNDSLVDRVEEFDLDSWLERVMKEMESFRFSPEDMATLREFFTFHGQTKLAPNKTRESWKGSYNLMIISEEPASVRRFARLVGTIFGFGWDETQLGAEKEWLQKIDDSRQGTRRVSPAMNLPKNTKLILVDECQDAPRMNLDGGGSARDASSREIENYNVLWNAVQKMYEHSPGTIILASGDEDVYRSTLRPFNALSQRMCSHHIRLLPRTAEDLYQQCMDELERSRFALAEDFGPALKKYFLTTYAAAELRSDAFVKDLIRQIYSRYFSQKREERILTVDCIPVYDPAAQSVEQVLGRLDRMVGLEKVKEEFRNIYRLQMAGLNDSQNIRYHMTFTGNPGTGKTTVARMAADLFFRMGVIKSNKLVVVKPADLISEWIGGTGSKAMDVIRRAYNGVLFIDEAYGIANMDRGYELLNILLHFGTLAAVFMVYWKRIWNMVMHPFTSELKWLIVATIPAVIAALVIDFGEAFEGKFR